VSEEGGRREKEMSEGCKVKG